MVKDLKEKLDSEIIQLVLPKRRYGVMSHLDNINYCIKQIRSYPGNGSHPVIGFFRLRSAMGTTETDHMALPREKAEELKREDSNHWVYYTIDDLLARKRIVRSGEYEVKKDGRILYLSQS